MHGIGRGLIKTLISCIALLSLATTAHASGKMESAGDIATAVVAVAAGGVTIGLSDMEGMVQLVKAAALDLTATWALKLTVNERRPDGSDNQSFPSAHTSVAFTSAEYLRNRYGWEYGLPAYGLAAFVAYSRVEAKKHYSRDVLAGAAIGIGSAYLFTSPNLRVNFHADVEPGYYGVRLSKVW